MPVTRSGPDRSVPAPLAVAASLVAVEAFVLGSLGVVEIASLRAVRLTMGATTSLFFIAAAAGLGWCAWSLWSARRWARGPAVMTQLICLGLAWNFWGDQTKPLSVGLVIVGVLAICGLMHPESTAVLEEDAGDT